MTAAFARMQFPGESAEYRKARNELLDAQMDLRRRTEEVAAMRRALPPGGTLPKDFVFERIGARNRPEKVKLTELFGEHDTLLLYSYMIGADRDESCSGCTHLLDGLDGAARHITQRAAFYVVAGSPLARLAAWKQQRGWNHLELISTAGNGYNAAYFGNTEALTPEMRAERGYEDGKDWDEPMLNVFTRKDGTIRHFWGTELTFARDEQGQDHRSLDQIDPVWALSDFTPEGRDPDWFPENEY